MRPDDPTPRPHTSLLLRAALGLGGLVGAAAMCVHAAQRWIVGVAEPSMERVAQAERLDRHAVTLAAVESALLLGTAILFTRWTLSALRVAAAGGVSLPRWSARAAAWSWWIPGVQLVRPPRVLGALVTAVRAKAAAASAPRPRDDGAVGYRDAAMAHAPRSSRALPIAVWWALWLGSRATEAAAALWPVTDPEDFVFRARIDLVSDALLVAAAVAAIVLVRGVDAALRELDQARSTEG
jgi:hypothetical protein